MMASDFIIDVTEADFEYQVLAYSQKVPVIVDFWAEWCVPCKVLGPMLERLAHEAQGEFRLAKLNVDQNPALAERYEVRSIPAVKAFKDGRMVAEFTGVIPEPRLRDFLSRVAPSQSDLTQEKALSLLEQRRAGEAEKIFRQSMETTPHNPVVLLGLAKSLLLQGKATESLSILQKFPASREYNSAETLLPLAQAYSRLDRGAAFSGEDPLDPAFFNALRLAKRGNIEAAMDGLLDILRENRRYRDGEARRIMLALLEMFGPNDPEARQYRNELASVLF